MNKLWGNKDDELKQKFILEFQSEVAKLDLAKGQLEINKSEAANPNRKWITWREMLGYLIVASVAWQWVILGIVSTLATMAGHPLDHSKIIQIEISDALYLLGVMLGADLSPLIINKIKNPTKK